MESIVSFALLFIVGILAAIINVMAGGGSALTLPLLIFLGLESSVANGTNRVALILQSIFAIFSFKQENLHQFRTSLKLALLTLPGAVIGAIVAIRVDDQLFEKLLGFVLIAILVTVIFPGKKVADSATNCDKSVWLLYPAMFAIGFYGGFIQAGVGFLIMASLKHTLKIDLVRINMHKVFIVLVFTLPTLFIFAISGNIDWMYGFVLGAGNSLGAWWSAKVSVKKGEKIIRIMLVAAMLVMSIKLLDLF